MAEPTGYTVSYSFAGWQATNPSMPLPAAAVDNEFSGISDSILSIISALQSVRRSDGKIQNEAVGMDALDAQVRAALGEATTTVADLDPTVFATQEEAEAAVASDKIMTPLRVKNSTDVLRPFASQAQAQAGSDGASVLSPARGADLVGALRPFASKEEAEAGVVTTKVMSPLRVFESIQAARRISMAVVQSISWGEISAGAGASQVIAVPGSSVGEKVMVGLPAGGLDDGLILRAWVSATDTVTLRAYNTTGSPITPTAAQNYSIRVHRY